MLKYLLIFSLIFALPSLALAVGRDPDVKLKKEYGDDLTHAPFFLRYSFLKTYHKDWNGSLYVERRDFLNDYETSLAAQKARDKAEAADEAAAEKERENGQKDLLRKKNARLKEQLAEEKAVKKADADRQKDFNRTIEDQQRRLQQIESEFRQEERDQRH